MYVYMHRQIDRWRDRSTDGYIFIYIYIERERDREI